MRIALFTSTVTGMRHASLFFFVRALVGIVIGAAMSVMPPANAEEGAAHIQAEPSAKLGIQDPITTKGAPNSIVERIDSAIIIPGEAHEALWVHPNVVTIPGDPIVIEMALRTTDRRGRDQHTAFNYFRTRDYFETLQPIAEPSAPAWRRIGLTHEDFEPVEGGPELPEPPEASWHWARNYTHLDKDTILQPFLTREGDRRSVQTVTAKIDGDRFVPLHVSNAWTNEAGRGLLEPQIEVYQGRCYMTVRAEDGHGHVLVSEDEGRSWKEPVPWTWDDGEAIAMHTTMTKLLAHSEGLLLVYTRIREDNENVFRNRAPLHCADVDTETLSLKRDTERILIPNRGQPVGNFWVWPINQRKSYVAAAEWPRDGRETNGDTWLAKIKWRQPNTLMTANGAESFAD